MKDERNVRFIIRDAAENPLADRTFNVDMQLPESFAFTYADGFTTRHVIVDISADGRDSRSFDINRVPELARDIQFALTANGFAQKEAVVRQALCQAEEAGELVGAIRRWLGMARRSDTYEHVVEEWADNVITAFVTAVTLGMSNRDMADAIERKLDIIFTRGWHENADVEPIDGGELPDSPVRIV